MGSQAASALEPEVLSVFVPPFVCKDDGPGASSARATLAKPRRRSFRKKRDRPRMEGDRDGPEDINIPDGVDLPALPQLCFPGNA